MDDEKKDFYQLIDATADAIKDPYGREVFLLNEFISNKLSANAITVVISNHGHVFLAKNCPDKKPSEVSSDTEIITALISSFAEVAALGITVLSKDLSSRMMLEIDAWYGKWKKLIIGVLKDKGGD